MCINTIKIQSEPYFPQTHLLGTSLQLYNWLNKISLFSPAGEGSKEQLPMVLKVPRLTKSTLSVCERPYSLLGFGDILVPGTESWGRGGYSVVGVKAERRGEGSCNSPSPHCLSVRGHTHCWHLETFWFPVQNHGDG